jgi:hypothetical protein
VRLVEVWRKDKARLEITCESCGKWACFYVSNVAMLHLKRRAPDQEHWPAEGEWQEAISLAERADARQEANGEIERVRGLAEAEGLRLAILEETSWRCPYCGYVCRLEPAG